MGLKGAKAEELQAHCAVGDGGGGGADSYMVYAMIV